MLEFGVCLGMTTMHVYVQYNFNTKLGNTVLTLTAKSALANLVVVIMSSLLLGVFPQAGGVTKWLMDSYGYREKCSYKLTLELPLLKFCWSCT